MDLMGCDMHETDAFRCQQVYAIRQVTLRAYGRNVTVQMSALVCKARGIMPLLFFVEINNCFCRGGNRTLHAKILKYMTYEANYHVIMTEWSDRH